MLIKVMLELTALVVGERYLMRLNLRGERLNKWPELKEELHLTEDIKNYIN